MPPQLNCIERPPSKRKVSGWIPDGGTKKQIMIKYNDLEKHFTAPVVISPFYGDIKIPRKLKKAVKKYVGVHWSGGDNGSRLWHYMEKSNPNYKKFLIKQICSKQSGGVAEWSIAQVC